MAQILIWGQISVSKQWRPKSDLSLTDCSVWLLHRFTRSESTLVAIPSASFGHIGAGWNHLVQILGELQRPYLQFVWYCIYLEIWDALVTLKFEKYVQKMLKEWQTVWTLIRLLASVNNHILFSLKCYHFTGITALMCLTASSVCSCKRFSQCAITY